MLLVFLTIMSLGKLWGDRRKNDTLKISCSFNVSHFVY